MIAPETSDSGRKRGSGRTGNACVTVEDGESVWLALREFESGNADFADCLIGSRNHSRGCETTFTFDRKAAKGRHFALVP